MSETTTIAPRSGVAFRIAKGSQLTVIDPEGGQVADSATLRDVHFVGCKLDHVDFSGATLTNVTFPDSILQDVTFERATLNKVDLSAAASLHLEGGHDGLRGATISRLQLLDLAPAFAALLGVKLTD